VLWPCVGLTTGRGKVLKHLVRVALLRLLVAVVRPQTRECPTTTFWVGLGPAGQRHFLHTARCDTLPSQATAKALAAALAASGWQPQFTVAEPK
jgi:hypothetical protein